MDDRILARAEWRRSWAVVLTAAIGVSLTSLYVYSIGAMLAPMQHDLGWTRTQITGGLSMATLIAALIGPFVGVAIDRIGSRRLAIPGIVAFCSSVALLSLATTPLMWWLLWALVGLCSAGVKPTVWAAAVSSIFDRSRGFAVAVILSGTGLGATLVPVVASGLISAVGWRLAYVCLGGLWTAASLPLAIRFFYGARERPLTATPERTIGSSPVAHAPLRTIMLSPRYILLGLAAMICTLVTTAYTVSIISLLSDTGMNTGTAATIAAEIGLVSIAGRLAGGYLLDRIDARLVMAAAAALPAGSGLLLLAMPGQIPAAIVAAGLIGLSVGSELNATSYLISRYFGQANFGALFGTLVSVMALATGAGPLGASLIYDHTGTYRLMLGLSIPLSLLAAGMVSAIRHVRRTAD
ncbi:MFS transporter [Sphingomonas solaris]|uniref:MFS transporter n=1 Tax=Alterirhizorhabdus solaris TaxID=2529389 RepID=A0A558R9B6_9SPHN|nr:MFS transporter [Sphingomonas solaris]TVV75964.1 MFS transporter [Sphingomonas solaris]